MAYVVYDETAPYSGSAARRIVAVEPTAAKARATAATDPKWTADGAKHDDTVGVGDWWTGAGRHAEFAPDADANRRKDVVEASCRYADAFCDLLNPGIYLGDGSAENAAYKRRYRETRLRAISAAAVLQAAARAAWTPHLIGVLYDAQRALMPLDPEFVRRWLRQHSTSAANPPAAGTWTAAFAVTGGQVVAQFPPNNTAKDGDVWPWDYDLTTPTPWAAASGGRLRVTFAPTADPLDFLSV